MRPVNLGSLLLSSGIALGEMVGIGGPAFAEVTIAPDTLPVDSQVVTEFLAPETPLYRIQGGTVVGGNLFHSLQTFRLSPQETARFEPGSGIERIITRVLGSDRSVLDGRIQIESITPVDLYLLNPRGIILGKNAVLDFNGAFLGSSSDRLLFEDGSIFEVNNPSVPLLTVSVPVGLQFGTQSTPIAIDRGNLSLENGFISKESGSIFHLIGSNINLKNTYFDIPQGDIYLHSFGDMELDGISDLVSSSLFARNAFRHFRLESQGNLRFINSSLVASQSFQFDSHQNIELSNIFVDTGTPALTIPVEKIADIELLAQGKILANPTATGNALSVIFVTSTRNNIDSGNIILKSGSDIDLSNTLFATTALSSGRAGSITLEANRNLRLDSTFFASDTFANNQAGVMNLKAGEDVILDNVTTLSSTSFGQGNASEIQVEAGGNVLLDNNSSMSSNTSDQGNAGSIRLRSERGNITLQRGGTIAASTFNAGKAGNILMEAGQSLNLDAGYIYSLTAGSGPGGQIDLRANQNIHLKGSSTITTAATFLATGPSGNIQLNAGEAILVEGQFQAFSPSALTVSTPTYLEQEAIGIDTNSPLRGSASPLGRAEPVSDRFFLAAQAADYPTVFEADQFPFVAIQGTVGPTDRKDFYQIEITEPGTTLVFDVDNTDQNLNAYLFVANTKNVVLASSREAIVPDLGSDRDEDPSFSFIFPSVGTYFIGIQPDEDLPDSPPPLTGTVQYTLNISRIPPNATNTRISSQTEASSAAGNLRLNAPLIQLKDGGTLAVNSQGTGPGGNIEVTGQRLELSNNALITAETRNSQGGNLTLTLSQWLQLQNGSQLSATAGTNQTGGNGGNITIHTPLVIALPLETNRITANAFSGNGGNIDIDTQSILGDRFLNISASSQLGIDGVVNIEFSGVGLENLLTLLADDVLDVSGQIAAHCHSSSYAQRQNQFVIVGRNGLPTDPRQALPRETLLSDLRWPGISGHSQTAAISFRDFPQASPPIQEAHTWVQRPDGAVELIGQQNPLSLGLENCR